MELEALVRDLRPDHTILLFGAGSSMPSHAPTPQAIIDHLSKVFQIPSNGFNLAEFTELVEQRSQDRSRMIREVCNLFKNLKPTAGLLNLPIYEWKSIYTTNYDNLIEQSYNKKSKPLGIFSSNFDFGNASRNSETRLYKIHGTINKDPSLGDQSRMILTESDYNRAQDYREHMFTALQYDLGLTILRHSPLATSCKPLVEN